MTCRSLWPRQFRRLLPQASRMQPTGEPLLELVRVMDQLRSPGGCPWDAEQTHESLVEYLIEEAYEAVEAIETDDRAGLREELGDVLLQVVFHARIAQDAIDQPFSIDDVAQGIVDKLISRHPHVFGDVSAETAAHVEANWQAMKAAEKGRTSVTQGIPEAMPALLLGAKLLRRASNGSLNVDVATANIRQSAQHALADVGAENTGPLLLALIEQAAAQGVDAEAALRAAIREHREAIIAVESTIS
jgi:XTP/dITP diphosphohydrolase